MFQVSRRYVSQASFVKDAHKILLVPLSAEKQYLYYDHGPNAIDKVQYLVRLDQWVNSKSHVLWGKMEKSKMSMNVKIVAYVKRLLNTIGWEEESFKSIPVERHLKETECVNIYTPERRFLEPGVLKTHIQGLCDTHKTRYRKHMLYCMVGIPMTLPIALIPVVPNIPCFYLMYRLYCNGKAYYGCKRLQNIISDDSRHKVVELEDFPTLNPAPEYIDQVVEFTHLSALKPHLAKATSQEHIQPSSFPDH